MRDIEFRGNKTQKNYFEGWYFKFVDEKNDLIVILIPGISNFSEKMAFLQYIIHNKSKRYSGFLKYDMEKFKIDKPFKLEFEHGNISKNHIKLSFENIKIDLHLKNFTNLKNTFFSPSIMGFFEYLKMPCYHDIVSLNHEVIGEIAIDDEIIQFNGNGYIEGDRGKNFPKYYIWAQCNNFENKKDSLFLSVADISTPLFKFLGHIAIYHYEGVEYRFASYLGSKARVFVSPDKKYANIEFKNKKHSLKIEIELNQGNTLIAPMNDNMDFKIKEQVKSTVKIDFDGKIQESKFCASELVNWDIKS